MFPIENEMGCLFYALFTVTVFLNTVVLIKAGKMQN